MKPYLLTTGLFFGLFALFHVWELVQGLRNSPHDTAMIIGVSVIIVVSGALAFWAFRLLRPGSAAPPG